MGESEEPKKKSRKRKKKQKTADPFEFPARKKRKRLKKSKPKLSQDEKELRKARDELAMQRRKSRNGSKTASLEQPFKSRPLKPPKKKRKRPPPETPIQFPLIAERVGEPSPMKAPKTQEISSRTKSIEERERLSPIHSSQSAFFSDDEDLEDFQILTGPTINHKESTKDADIAAFKSPKGEQVPCLFDDIEEVTPKSSPIAAQKIRKISDDVLDPLAEEDQLEASSILLRSPDLEEPLPYLDMRSPPEKEMKIPRKPVLRLQTPDLIKNVEELDLRSPGIDEKFSKKQKNRKRKTPFDVSAVDTSGLSQKGYAQTRKTKKRKRKSKQIPVDPVLEAKAKQQLESAIEFYKSIDSMDASDCFIVEVQK